MKIRRKSTACLNCGKFLDRNDNYCSNCGQENNHNNVSFGKLLKDFFGNYLSFDSRFGKSIQPFFTKPGYISLAFFEGKRVTYANPIRLYLVISLFYFLTVNKGLINTFKDKKNNLVTLSDPSKEYSLNNVFKRKEMDSLHLIINDQPALTDYMKAHLNLSELIKMNRLLQDSILIQKSNKFFIENRIVLYQAVQEINENRNKKKRDKKSTDTSFNITFMDGIEDKFDFGYASELAKNDELSADQVVDSATIAPLSTVEHYFCRQIIRVEQSDEEGVVGYIAKNLPIMMILLIPIYALLLKLMYIRRKQHLYIHHIIHALHLHSFAYICYGLAFIIIFVTPDWTGNFTSILSFILVSTYCFLSFKKVYQQHWFKTLIKFNIVGMLYFALLATTLVVEMLVSIMLY